MSNVSELRQKLFPYMDINESEWFKDVATGACQNSKREQNRIYVYFKEAANAIRCMAVCNARNISYMEGPYDSFRELYRVDILMNWKTRMPSRIRRNEPQFLDKRN